MIAWISCGGFGPALILLTSIVRSIQSAGRRRSFQKFYSRWLWPRDDWQRQHRCGSLTEMSQLETNVQTRAVRPSVITWGRAHWLVGTLTLLLFPLAGLYMRYVALVPQLDDAPRLVYRSRFLFLLLIALVNLGMTYAAPQRFLQRLASAIVLAAPVPLLASFLFDPARGVRS